MKVQDNFAKLIGYLCEHPEPTTIARLVAVGLMNSSDMYYALQYGVRNGVIERIKVPAESMLKERTQYRWTGQPLILKKKDVVGHSFDALLAAWGIAGVPPCLPGCKPSRRVVIN